MSLLYIIIMFYNRIAMPWLKNGGVTEPSDGIHREALCADPWLFWRLRIVEEVVQTTSLTTDDPARRGKVDDFACSKLLKLYTYDICMSMYTYVSLYIYMFDVNDVCIYNIIYYYFTRPHMGGNIRIKHRCGRNWDLERSRQSLSGTATGDI